MLVTPLRFLTLAACGIVLVGCKDTFVAPKKVPATIRVVNSTYQTTDAGNTLSTAQPRAIDVLFDSSLEKGIAALAPNSVTGEGGGEMYREIGYDLHTFVARLAAPATPNTSLYSNTATPRGEFLPKMYFTPNTNYTLIVAGVAPTTGRPAANTFYLNDGWSTIMPIVDDLSRPPVANGVRQARFRMVNAAPFGTGGSSGQILLGYLTTGATKPAPSDLLIMASTMNADFRAQSAYVNATAGTYVFTVTTNTNPRTIIAQEEIVLAPGDVRTFLLLNTGFTTTSSGASHKMVNMLDAKYE